MGRIRRARRGRVFRTSTEVTPPFNLSGIMANRSRIIERLRARPYETVSFDHRDDSELNWFF